MDHTHALNLFGGEETELDLLDGAQRRLGVWEENVRHIGGNVIVKGGMKNAMITGEAGVSLPGLMIELDS